MIPHLSPMESRTGHSVFFLFPIVGVRRTYGFRGRPLMIWGGGREEISEMNLFFPRNPFCIKFSRRRASEIIFFSISSGPTPRSLMVVPLGIYTRGNYKFGHSAKDLLRFGCILPMGKKTITECPERLSMVYIFN